MNLPELFQVSPASAEDVVGVLTRHWPLVPTVFDKRRKNIRDSQDSHDVAYVLRTKSVRISTSVEIFVMMSNRIENFKGNVLVVLKRVISKSGVRFDNRTLNCIQTSMLI